MFRLLRFFSIASLFAFIIVTIVLGLWYRNLAVNDLIEQEQGKNVALTKAFANSRIRIEGNTDNVGSRSSNVALSKKRAQAVRDYLVQVHNMSPSRIIVVGNGPDKPVASNDDESGRAKNRRTDFELVGE